LPTPEPDLLERLAQLYRDDPLLANRSRPRARRME
jgi:hypothetical protein